MKSSENTHQTVLNKQIPLNHYQQLMLRLNTLTPYNAVHSLLIDPNHINLISLENSINAIINQLFLGIPEFSSDFKKVIFKPLTAPIKLETSPITLKKHIEKEMAYSFSINEFPLRFFIIQEEFKCYLSITYNHWIADAYAIYHFVKAIFTHLKENELTEISLEVPEITSCFPHVYKNLIFYYRYVGVIKNIIQFSRAFRTKITCVEDTNSGCHIHFFEKELLQQLLIICKKQQITLNDLFITVLALIFGRATEENRKKIKQKFPKFKRDRIIIAVISNIRSQSRPSLSKTFGLFLGFFYLSLKSPEKYSFKRLSKLVHSDTERLKQKNAAIKQYLLFKVQRIIWDKTKKISSKFRLFSKNTPITVGISNMNLSQDSHAFEGADQYIRLSPTAMVCPIVFNLTTFNSYLSLGINYRKACYTSSEAETLKNAFLFEINQLVTII